MKHYKRKMIIMGSVMLLLLGLAVLLCVWFFGARYPSFDGAKREEGPIPLEDGFCPQGICPLPEASGYDYAVSGYLKGGPSRVYLVGETAKYVTLKKGGEELTTHFGGVTCTGNFLVVASGKELVRVSLSDALNAGDGAAVPVKDSFSTGLNNAYCYFFEDKLYVGEFYRKGNYETDPSHHIQTKGETNYAFVYVFEADEEKAGGVAAETPVLTVSVPALVQGIAVYEGGIALSTSYGLPDSHLSFYEPKESDYTDGMLILNSSNLKETLTLPCMSEEIYEEDGRLYVLFESKADKYKQFVRRQTDAVYSVALP